MGQGGTSGTRLAEEKCIRWDKAGTRNGTTHSTYYLTKFYFYAKIYMEFFAFQYGGKQMKKLVSIVVCAVLIFCFASCQTENAIAEESDSVIAEPIASFDTIESFIILLKKNPKDFIGNQISIKGYMDKFVLNTIYTQLEDVYTPSDELKDPNVARIKLFITDEVMLTVVGDGDYVEVCGTVEIVDGEICLKNCTCTVITAFEEMK